MEMRLHQPPRPVRELRPDVPAYIEAICAKCLAVAPGARYASMRELIAALEPGSAAAPRRRRWRAPAIAAGAACLGGVIVALFAWPHHRGGDGPQRTVPMPAEAVAPVPTPPSSQLVTALLLGFENRTDDPVFDRTLDVVVEYALRRSTRVDPYGTGRVHALANELGTRTDELAAKLAARDHIRVVSVQGAIATKGAGYEISLIAKDATGATVVTQTAEAPALARVPAVTTRLASALRSALGESLSEPEREALSISESVDADHEFAVGRAATHSDDIDNGIAHLQRAIAKAPDFALAHLELGIALANSQHTAEARDEYASALKAVDRVGERDRLKFLGDYYQRVTEDYGRAIAEYEQLLAKWPTDLGAETNIANAYQMEGNKTRMLEAGLRALHDHPHEIVVHLNFPIYEIIAGHFEQAVADLRAFTHDYARPQATTYAYLAIASLYLGHRDDAVATCDQLAAVDQSLGLAVQADIALSEGRLGDAAALLDKGILADRAKHLVSATEVKLEMMAEVELRRGDKARARAAAAQVEHDPKRAFEAALVLLAAGDDQRANATAAKLATETAPSRRALAKLIEAEALRVHGKPQEAVAAIQQVLRISDSPIAHLLLARAALDSRAYADAYDELKTCEAHRTEAAFGIDDVFTYRYVPPITYYLAKAQEGIGSSEAQATYRKFLAMMHDPDPADPMVADARKHVSTR
jgi:tetratricopeptide (TPR) repeat protein